jgi:hypothetical protein
MFLQTLRQNTSFHSGNILALQQKCQGRSIDFSPTARRNRYTADKCLRLWATLPILLCILQHAYHLMVFPTFPVSILLSNVIQFLISLIPSYFHLLYPSVSCPTHDTISHQNASNSRILTSKLLTSFLLIQELKSIINTVVVVTIIIIIIIIIIIMELEYVEVQ